eukprot:870107-Alexandrium_andersonii.AAC.1
MRRHLGDCMAVDRDAAVAGLGKVDDSRRRLMVLVQSGAIWDAHILHKLGHAPSPKCPHCGADMEDKRHMYWKCPFHDEVRKSYPSLQGINPDVLPHSIVDMAVPPEMMVGDEPFWGPGGPSEAMSGSETERVGKVIPRDLHEALGVFMSCYPA